VIRDASSFFLNGMCFLMITLQKPLQALLFIVMAASAAATFFRLGGHTA
jgi:hypothetical protein